MTKDKALKMAIETLEYLIRKGEPELVRTLLNCKEALAQPAQEPVAWIIQTQKIDGEPTEPYAMMGKYKYVADTCDFGEPIPLYTHPAPSWQGLSDDELSHLKYLHVDYELFDEGEYGTECNVYVDEFARAIEQTLKEKNT